MKHLRFARLFPWLLIAICPPLLGHCGGALEHGTETGNPPVVEQQKLHVVLHDDGVEVVGEAGAVSHGATVTVTNTRSGDRAEAIARADGSVNVSVPGTLADEYEVTVASGGGSQTVRVTASTVSDTSSTNTASADAGSSQLSACDALYNAAAERIRTDYAAADQSCQSAADCVDSPRALSCYSGCSSYTVSAAAAAATQAAVEQDLAPLCSQLAAADCGNSEVSCAYDPSTRECYKGTCQRLDISRLSCNEISSGAAERLSDDIEASDHACSQDADCVLYDPSLSCSFSCPGFPTAVAVTALTALTSTVERLEGNFCGEFEKQSCPGPFALPCPAPLFQSKAVCLFPSQGVPGTPGQCTLTSAQR